MFSFVYFPLTASQHITCQDGRVVKATDLSSVPRNEGAGSIPASDMRRFMCSSEWPSGLRRLDVGLSPSGGVGSNPTSDTLLAHKATLFLLRWRYTSPLATYRSAHPVATLFVY